MSTHILQSQVSPNLKYAIKIAEELKLNISPHEIEQKNWNVDGLNALAEQIQQWRIKKGFRTEEANLPEKIALTHSELSEALEGHRHGDKEEISFELADALIRLFDMVSSLNINIEEVTNMKMNINEARPVKHGKKY